MSRIARVVVPGVPYHVTHRGNRREAIFFHDDDREYYLALLSERAGRHGLDLYAYCLMTNHVHLLVLPGHEHSMARAIGEAHMLYSRRTNAEQRWSGHLWANRSHSTALDGEHTWNAVRYIEANPVRAGMVGTGDEYAWSSCREHAGLGHATGILSHARPFPGHIGAEHWTRWINAGAEESAMAAIRQNTHTGRPTGSDAFVKDLEERLGRILVSAKVGRPRKCTETSVGMNDLFGEDNA